LLGALDGALAIVGSALAAKGVEVLGLGGRALTSAAARMGGQAAERASETLARRVTAGAVEAALDGAFSGAVSEAAGTILDARTWREGVWQGLVRVGQSALVGGLTGVVASVLGKDPPDLRFWISTGPAPAFLRFQGAMFLKGPTWRIDLSAPRWPNER